MGGCIDGLTEDGVFDDVLFTCVSGVATLTVLSDSWTVDIGAVFEMETTEVE